MRDAKPVKRIKADLILDEERSKYVFHQTDGTAIKLRSQALEAFRKIAMIPGDTGAFFSDTLALTFHYRRLAGIEEDLKNWENEYSLHKFPPNKANTHIFKLLNRSPFMEYINGKEMEELLLFIFTIPPGYDLSFLIRAHSEFKPIIS